MSKNKSCKTRQEVSLKAKKWIAKAWHVMTTLELGNLDMYKNLRTKCLKPDK